MNGWGSVFLAVTPDGAALPCHAAKSLPGLIFPNVTEHSLSGIWYRSKAFNRYRGDTWMKEPCRSCSEKEKNFGGCRCQAYALTGEAENADPVCSKSADHRKVQIVLSQAQADDPKAIQERPMFFRTNINSHRLASKT